MIISMCSNRLDLPATQTLCVQENSCPMDQGVKLWFALALDCIFWNRIYMERTEGPPSKFCCWVILLFVIGPKNSPSASSVTLQWWTRGRLIKVNPRLLLGGRLELLTPKMCKWNWFSLGFINMKFSQGSAFPTFQYSFQLTLFYK